MTQLLWHLMSERIYHSGIACNKKASKQNSNPNLAWSVGRFLARHTALVNLKIQSQCRQKRESRLLLNRLEKCFSGPKCSMQFFKGFLDFWETHAWKFLESSEKRTSGIYFWSTYTLTLSRGHIETLAFVETHGSLMCQTFTIFIFQMGLLLFPL